MRFHLWGLALGIAVALQSPVAHAQQDDKLTEASAISKALVVAPELKASAFARRAAAGARAQAAVRPNPTLQLDAENFAGADPFNGFAGGEYTYSLGQKIERGGKRAARISIAEAQQDIAKWSEARTNLDLIYEVRNAYLDVMAARAALTLAEEQHAIAVTLERAMRQRVSSARDPEAALLRVKARALEFETDRALAADALAVAKERLSLYWGDARTDFDVETATLFAPAGGSAIISADTDETPDMALLDANESLASATMRLEQANAKQDPTISLGVRHLAGDDAVAGILSVSMPLALFDTNKGAIAEARAERSRAEWLKQAAMLRRTRDYKTALGRYNAAMKEARAIRDDVAPEANAALAAARRGFDRGAFTYLDVIEAQRALADLKAREIAALTRLRQSEIILDRLNGRAAENWDSVQ